MNDKEIFEILDKIGFKCISINTDFAYRFYANCNVSFEELDQITKPKQLKELLLARVLVCKDSMNQELDAVTEKINKAFNN